RPLLPHLRPQFGQLIEPGQGPLVGRRPLRARAIDQPDVSHAALDRRPVGPLHAHAGGVHRHVATPPPLGILRPRPLPRPAERLPGGAPPAQALPGRLGGPLGRGFGQAQGGHPRQHLRGGLGEARQRPGEADQLLGGWRQVAGRQAQDFVPGAVAPAAVPAVVIGSAQADGADGALDRFGLPPLEACRLAAVGAGAAGALVPPFFRPWRAASRALAPILWTASRTWNSVAPRRSPSALVASSWARLWRSASAACRRTS